MEFSLEFFQKNCDAHSTQKVGYLGRNMIDELRAFRGLSDEEDEDEIVLGDEDASEEEDEDDDAFEEA